MAGKRTDDATKRRLLSLWEPAKESGDPVGVIATTFTLDTALFEEECLARFAGVQSDPVRDGALYYIEREERLANVQACVIADIHHCSGARSLRWDLLAARPQRGVMHAKISMLVWRNHVRVLVGSANLTDSGYRRNQETATAIDFTLTQTDRTMLGSLLQFLRELLELTDGPGRGRALSVLAWVDENFHERGIGKSHLKRQLVFVSPKRDSLFKQLADLWPGGPIHEAHVVSPFFDKKLQEFGPEFALWEALRQRGAAQVHFHVEGERSVDGVRWALAAPSHLIAAQPKGRSAAETFLHPVATKRVPTDSGVEDRPLHAKSMVFADDACVLVCMGSSNFTSAGTGSNPSSVVNIEANVVYVLRAPRSDSLRQSLLARVLNGAKPVQQLDAIDWVPVFDGEDDAGETDVPLPRFFGLATIGPSAEGHAELRLKFNGTPPEGSWQIRAMQSRRFDSVEWERIGRPALFTQACPDNEPLPVSLDVEWGADKAAEWPVNVELPSVLPSPPELKGLSLQALLELLASGRPMHEVLRAWMRKQPDDDETALEQSLELIDPHAKIDTSGFLIKRTQRACAALHGLRMRMEEPVLSEAAMAWRIDGPIGARAVMEAIRRHCDPHLPAEWAFLLCEAIRELRGAQLVSAHGAEVSPVIRSMHGAFVNSLEGLLPAATKKCSQAMKRFLLSTPTSVLESHVAA